jgi:hypothetical protein
MPNDTSRRLARLLVDLAAIATPAATIENELAEIVGHAVSIVPMHVGGHGEQPVATDGQGVWVPLQRVIQAGFERACYRLEHPESVEVGA